MKKLIVVSDSFKGTLSSQQICDIAERTAADLLPGCEVVCLPIADGGEGTVDAFVRACGSEAVSVAVRGAYGVEGGALSRREAPVTALYARFGDTAVIEMAQAAGLPSVQDRPNPELTTTYGVGELIAHAVKAGARHVLLGLGGSATNDGGCGMAAALGTVFTDSDGKAFIPVGGTLADVRHIDNSRAAALLSGVDVTVMCDVTNPMFGERGAAYVFAPQKGADEAMVRRLDAGLKSLSAVIEGDMGVSVSDIPGAGAAGAMGAGCVAFLGAALRSGIEAMLDATGFDAALRGADLVITGEGRLDGQSLGGKVISGVAARTKRAGVSLIALTGAIGSDLLGSGALTALPEKCCGLDVYRLPDIGLDAVYTTNVSGLSYEDIIATGCAAGDYEKVLRAVLGKYAD